MMEGEKFGNYEVHPVCELNIIIFD